MSAADMNELAEEEAELDSLDASYTDEGEPSSDPFDETDPVAAEWVARRLRSARLRVAQRKAWHARMVARDDAWLAEQTAKDLDRIELAESQLRAYAEDYLARNPKAPKTITLPSGVIRTRAGSTSVEVVNEEAALIWAAAERPELIRLVEPKPPAPHIDKTVVKELLGAVLAERDGEVIDTTTGEQIPGLAVVHNERSITIDTGGDI